MNYNIWENRLCHECGERLDDNGKCPACIGRKLAIKHLNWIQNVLDNFKGEK